jgi:hypothetical protein
MRTSCLIIVAMLCASPALAESTRPLKLDMPASNGKTVPLKGKASSNSCAAYGPGFVRLEGSDTCVEVGGFVRVDGGVRR